VPAVGSAGAVSGALKVYSASIEVMHGTNADFHERILDGAGRGF